MNEMHCHPLTLVTSGVMLVAASAGAAQSLYTDGLFLLIVPLFPNTVYVAMISDLVLIKVEGTKSQAVTIIL